MLTRVGKKSFKPEIKLITFMYYMYFVELLVDDLEIT